MSELFNALGINWAQLLAQGVTFLLLVVVLRLTVYTPLLKIMQKRRERIEHGLKGAEEADRRLAEVEKVKDQRLAEADKQAVAIVTKSENTAKEKFHEIVSNSEKKADNVLKEAATIAKQKEKEQMDQLYKEAQSMIKEALSKTVELDPVVIDEKLINEAVNSIKGRA